ncbi:hypothetical protein HDU67_003376 [Dinochytrium kinnereticum]|nr:hypothetical protein HDU67_003376 [Dinochytrium kinnereticum]
MNPSFPTTLKAFFASYPYPAEVSRKRKCAPEDDGEKATKKPCLQKNDVHSIPQKAEALAVSLPSPLPSTSTAATSLLQAPLTAISLQSLPLVQRPSCHDSTLSTPSSPPNSKQFEDHGANDEVLVRRTFRDKKGVVWHWMEARVQVKDNDILDDVGDEGEDNLSDDETCYEDDDEAYDVVDEKKVFMDDILFGSDETPSKTRLFDEIIFGSSLEVPF